MTELIVFDFDGTIIDSEWPHFAAVQGAFAEVGAEMTLDTWQTRIGRADNRPWADELRDIVGDEIDVDELTTRWRAKKNSDTWAEPIRDGIVDLINAATTAGCTLAVASSSPRDWVQPHLERLGLFDLMSAVVTRDDVERGKPWPDLFSLACTSVAIEPARAVAIEDSHHGCVSAKDAGLACVVVPNRVTHQQDFSRADHVASSVAAVPRAVFGL